MSNNAKEEILMAAEKWKVSHLYNTPSICCMYQAITGKDILGTNIECLSSRDNDGRWSLDISYHNDSGELKTLDDIPIIYCPFCGRKLKKADKNQLRIEIPLYYYKNALENKGKNFKLEISTSFSKSEVFDAVNDVLVASSTLLDMDKKTFCVMAEGIISDIERK